MSKNLRATSVKCSGCGDDMSFDPSRFALFCSTCHSEKKINADQYIKRHDIGEKLNTHKNDEWADKTVSMQCPNCAATTILRQFATSVKCQYCETPLIANSAQFSGLKPDAIVPFAFNKAKAEELFKNKIGRRWLAPRSLKKSLKADTIRAFYFPAFVFDAECHSVYSGRLYENVTVRDDDGSTSTERRYFNIKGEQFTDHKNIEVEASSRLSQFELNSIRPYDISKAYAYTDEFVYGYALENYSSSVNETNVQAQTIIKQDIKNTILKKYNHDGVSEFNMQTTFISQHYSYCVLPIYRINYSYKKKNYSNIMNGQTGKLGGDYPKSVWKILLIVLFFVAIFGLPILAVILSIFA